MNDLNKLLIRLKKAEKYMDDNSINKNTRLRYISNLQELMNNINIIIKKNKTNLDNINI